MARLNHVKSFRGTSKTKDGTLSCGKCGKTIKIGDGYRWWANKLPGSRGSFRNIRCMTCTIRPSEMKPGRTGQIMRIGEDFDDAMRDYGGWGQDDFQSAAENLAGEIRSFGEELEESAQNMEDGFGHETYQSGELRERAERITSAADELDDLDLPEQDEHECEHCDGGKVDADHEFEAEPAPDDSTCAHCGMDAEDENHHEHDCDECGGTGFDDDAWREAMAEKLQDAWSEAEGEMYA